MGQGRSFENSSFENSYWLSHRTCWVMKYGMSGILQQVRIGQVRKARKSSIIWPPLLSMSIFRNSEKNRQISVHPGGVRWWKNWLKGLFKRVRLGQVRKAIKSWKSEAWGPQSIRWPVLDENLKERFLKERPTPISISWNMRKNSISRSKIISTSWKRKFRSHEIRPLDPESV